MIKLWILKALLLFSVISSAQPPDNPFDNPEKFSQVEQKQSEKVVIPQKPIPFTEIIAKCIQSNAVDELIFSDKEILTGRDMESWFNFNYPNAPKDSLGRYIIETRLEFRNCVFKGSGFQNLAFTKGLWFRDSNQLRLRNSSISKYVFTNEKFDQPSFEISDLVIGHLSVNISLDESVAKSNYVSPFGDDLVRCSFYRNQIQLADISIENFESIQFLQNVIDSRNFEGETGSDLDSLVFDESGRIYKSRGSYRGVPELSINGNLNTLIRDNVVFLEPDIRRYFLLIDSNIKNLVVEDNNFGAPFHLNNVEVSDRLIVRGNVFGSYFGITNSLIPEFFVNIDWGQLKGNKLSILPINESFMEEAGFYIRKDIPYHAENTTELANYDLYKELLDLHARLYQIYKSKADIEGSNGVYAELQQLYTRRYAYLVATDGGIKNWFRLKLNRLLEFYIDYGTDPARALVVSFYLMLFFAVFYFFFPSEWDTQTKPQILSNLRSALDKHERGTTKAYLNALGLLILSFINAFALSLNAFVTLGFGSIPTRGIARYVCILQGFMGWFLLSLFTVALINQVIF